jgi:hypothetical protein
LTITHLAFRVHAQQKQLAVFLDHAADAQAFDDICADSNDFHEASLVFMGSQVLLLILAKKGHPGAILVGGGRLCVPLTFVRPWA